MVTELLLRALDMLDEQPPPPLDPKQEQAVSLFAKSYREKVTA